MNPNTVTTGQVNTRVCRLGNDATTAHHRLNRLTVIVDVNGSQVDGPVSSVTTLEPLGEKWRSFGWRVAEVDGHDVEALSTALDKRNSGTQPFVILARTQILGGMKSIPATLDGHFIKLDKDLERALIAELEAALA